jgi:hypothetical protein
MSYQVRNAKRARGHVANTARWQIDRDTERGRCLSGNSGAFSTAKALNAFCDVNDVQLEYCTHYGEPGYDDPGSCILFANWNEVPKSVQTRLKAQGYALEWSDEWYVDYNNGKAYRTSADSHGWESRIMYSDAAGDYLTPDDDVELWVQACEGNSSAALPARLDESEIAELGWEKQTETYESGLREGSNDNPESIADALVADGKTFMFQLGRSGDAYTLAFHVWVKIEKSDES